MEGVELTFTEGALKAISLKAIERKTGARGLRSILESILLDTMFELPTLENVDEIVINEEVIQNSAAPLFIYGPKESKSAKGTAKS
jgi:ATP-dependent Clp protease ATP-binding subunit ClpX